MACVTLEKNEQGYQIISNVLIPIPMYLDGPPNNEFLANGNIFGIAVTQ